MRPHFPVDLRRAQGSATLAEVLAALTTDPIIDVLSKLAPDQLAIGMTDAGRMCFRVSGTVVLDGLYDVHDDAIADWLIARAAQWRREYRGEAGA